MSVAIRLKIASAVVFAALLAAHAAQSRSQASYPSVNDAPNPYKSTINWARLPEGRVWGGSTGAAVDSKGNVWAIERCGANNCDKSKC